jgi:hypothetical protein
MTPYDDLSKDPESRIGDLERQLSDATAGEAPPTGSEGPRPGLRLGWLVLAVMIAALVVSGVMLAGRITGSRPVTGRPTAAEATGGGTFSRPTPQRSSPERPPAPPTGTFSPPPGDSVSVAGVGKSETIACKDRAASISGVDNEVVLTGHCVRVDVSGVRNTVTVEEADAIVVSGMDNNVTYRSGNPELDQSGLRNTLQRG